MFNLRIKAEKDFRFKMRLDILVSAKFIFLRKEKPRSLGIDLEGGASYHDPRFNKDD